MKFLPKENITFKTKLKEDEIIIRLSEIIEPEKFIRFSLFGTVKSKAYEGTVTGKTFSIKRIIGYRNSFLPRITGYIEHDMHGTAIKVRMRLQIFVYLFLSIWCSGAGIGGFYIIKNIISDPEFNPWIIFIPIGMLLFVYLMTLGAFKYESSRSIKDLQTLFEAELINI